MDALKAASRVAVPYGPENAASVRHRLRRELEETGAAEAFLIDAEIVLGELLGNALMHGRPCPDNTVRVAWSISGPDDLVISVTDGGEPDWLRALDVPPDSGRGRGLRMVDELSREWGVERHGPGVTVWARLGGG